MSMVGLYIPRGESWQADFESELLRFPTAVHDDQVDALGLIGQLLDSIRAPTRAEESKPKNVVGYASGEKTAAMSVHAL